MEGLRNYFAMEENYEPPPNTSRPSRKAKKKAILLMSRNARRAARPRNNKTVKVLKGKPSVSNTNIRAAKRFVEEIATTPVFLVSGHSCICLEDGKCFGEEPSRYFKIPRDTYIATFGVPGDAFCMTNAERSIAAFYDDIRKFMYTHSVSDVIQVPGIGRDSFSLLSNLKRATGDKGRVESTPYPNIAYSFNEFTYVTKKVKGVEKTMKKIVPREENEFGVYRLDTLPPYFDGNTLDNRMSIREQDEKRDNWFLEDIIQETYEKAGVKRGIFILAGCLTSCNSRKAATGPHMDRAAMAMEIAHNMYNTLCPTLTNEELYTIYGGNSRTPYNIAIPSVPVTMEPSEVKEMVSKGLLTAKNAMKLPLLFHGADLEMLQEMADAE